MPKSKKLADEKIIKIVKESFPHLEFEKITEVMVPESIFTIDKLKSGKWRLIYTNSFLETL